MKVLRAENLFKKYGNYIAVDNISFSVEAGKIFGMLGPNGAGKTTSIRMVTNILAPDSGSVYIFDEIANPKHQEKIGYLPEERGLYKKLKVIEQLLYFGQLKGMKRSEALLKARFWLSKMDAADWENKKIQELSKGMQQKVQFISTIMHDPPLVILDEPFSGLDPINTELLKQIILDLKKQGKAIMLSTHIMSQVEQLCDEICLIDHGKVLISGNVREIKKSYGKDTVLIEFEGDSNVFNELKNVQILNKSENRIEFRINGDISIIENLQKELFTKVIIFKYQLAEPSLNEIFIDVVTKKEQVIENQSL